MLSSYATPRSLHSFPTRRSSDLISVKKAIIVLEDDNDISTLVRYHLQQIGFSVHACTSGEQALSVARETDRKSTRLNSSHLGISYAVFCLKKNNDTRMNMSMHSS